MFRGETITVVKQTWKSITSTPERQQFVGERLIYNYLQLVPSARSFFPTTSDELFEDETFRQGAFKLVSCINRVINMLENQRHPRFRALLRSYGKMLSRYNILPVNYTMAWVALIETLQDVLEERFTELLLAYWIDIIEPMNAIMAKGVSRHFLRV